MLMMKAEVTVENRPACNPIEHAQIWGTYGTHENEGGIQIHPMLLHELLVVLFSLLVVMAIECRPRILLSGRQVYRFLAA